MGIEIKALKSVNNPKSGHGIYPYRGKIAALDAEQILSQLPMGGVGGLIKANGEIVNL